MANPAIDDLEEFEFTGTGSDGMRYQRLLAINLALKATLASRPFKLAYEWTAAGKFDDVIFYLEETREWWLIQAKHTQNTSDGLSEEMLLRDDKSDFSLAKYLESLCGVRESEVLRGKRVKFFILTNRKMDSGLMGKCDEIEDFDQLLKFSKEGKHYKYKADKQTIKSLVERTGVKFKGICSAISELFEKGTMNKAILDYKTPLRFIFSIDADGKVRLVDDLSQNEVDSRTYKLFEILKGEFQNRDLTIEKKKMSIGKESFWLGESRLKQLPPFIDQAVVEEFFANLILSVGQPRDDELTGIICKEMQVWMRDWIPPEHFARLTNVQLELPLIKSEAMFQEWEQSKSETVGEESVKRGKKKKFLTINEAKCWIEFVEQELLESIKQKPKQSCLSLKDMEKYYINRRISYSETNKKRNLKQIEFNNLTDNDFIDQNYTTFKDQKCFILVAEPGMGKSTLWQHLAFAAQKRFPEKHVYLLYLNNIREPIESVKSLDDVMAIFEHHLSSNSCKNFKIANSEIILFLDAYDELRSENLDFLPKAIDILLKKENLKLFISTRQRMKDLLENSFNTEAMSVEPLSYADQELFLKKFWDVEKKFAEQVDEFIQQFLKAFRQGILGRQFEFLGTPLLLRMLANIYSGFIEQIKLDEFIYTNVFDQQVTIVDVYEKFVTKSLRMTFNKINNIPTETEIPRRCKQLLNFWEFEHQQIAIKELLPEEYHSICSENFKQEVERIRLEIVENDEESLLIEIFEKYPRFTHLSYCEFLAAKYVYNYIANFDYKSYKKEIASFFRKQSIVRTFFVEMANTEMGEKHLEFLSSIGDQAAFWAVKGNCLNLVKYLQKHFDFEAIRYDFLQYSMLHIAVQSGAVQTLEFLLESGPNVEVFNWNCETPLLLAYNNLEILKILVANGANLHAGRDFQVQRRKSYSIKILKDEEGSDPEGDFDNIILHRAIQMGSKEVILYLIEQNVNINNPNADGVTPVHQAAIKNRLDILEILTSKGARLDGKDKLKNTMLHFAAENGSKDVVKYLLEQKFDAKSKNLYKETALDLAKKKGKEEVVKMLVSHEEIVKKLVSHKTPTDTLLSSFDKLKI